MRKLTIIGKITPSRDHAEIDMLRLDALVTSDGNAEEFNVPLSGSLQDNILAFAGLMVRITIEELNPNDERGKQPVRISSTSVDLTASRGGVLK